MLFLFTHGLDVGTASYDTYSLSKSFYEWYKTLIEICVHIDRVEVGSEHHVGVESGSTS